MMMPQSSTPELKILLTGLAMGESPRWHEGRLWFSDWGAQEILAIDSNGHREVVLRTPFALPFCIDWLPAGRLLIVAGMLAAAGVAITLLGRLPFRLGHLPGGIEIHGKNSTFYFPLATCLVISVVLSLVMWLFRR